MKIALYLIKNIFIKSIIIKGIILIILSFFNLFLNNIFKDIPAVIAYKKILLLE